MALALHVFSAIEQGVATLGTVTVADERWAWVSLALVPEIAGNARRYHDLLRLGPPADLFETSRRALAGDVGEETARGVAGFDWRQAARQQAGAAARCGARLVLLGDPEYPAAAPPDRPAAAVSPGAGRDPPRGRARHGHRRLAPRDALRAADGRAAGRGPGWPRGDRRERPGAGGGHGRPPGSPRRRGPDAGRPGLWRGRGVSPRERRPGGRGRRRPAPWCRSSRWGRPRCPTTSRRGTGSSPVSRWAPWSSRPRSGAGPSSRRAWRESSAGRSTRCPGTSRPPGARARTA